MNTFLIYFDLFEFYECMCSFSIINFRCGRMTPPHSKRLGLKHVIVHFRNDFTQRQVIHNTFDGEGAALPTRTSGARARLFFLNFAYCCGSGAGGGSNRCWIRSWSSRSLRLASAPCTLRAAATCKPWLLFLRMWMNLHAGHTRFQCSTIRFEQQQQSVIKTNQELRPKDLLYFIQNTIPKRNILVPRSIVKFDLI